jgi:predicted Zn-dependent peptidase
MVRIQPLTWLKQRCSPIGVLAIATILSWSLIQPLAWARDSSPTPNAGNIQPYIDRVMDQVTEFTLENGIRFLVLERHQAPIVSFMTYFNVGAAEEETGKTGAAHYLEHLAFKGTSLIGTKDYSAEKPLLDEMDQLFDQLLEAEANQDDQALAQIQGEFDAVRTEAAGYVEQNEFGRIVEQEGGVGLNATTAADATRYFYSFPSNKLELWFSLESERFLDPVFREFYEEKDVILEERRMRTDNSPIGRMVEAFLETAFPNYPYGRPIIGYADDLHKMTRGNIETFFQSHYTPDRMVIAIVGDVDADQVKDFADSYFGRFEARPAPPPLVAVPTPQTETQEITLELQSEPWYLEGYKQPSLTDPDYVIYETIASLLSDGRTSRLYQSLVETEQVALDIGSSIGFPGDRYPNLLLLYALTAPGHTVDDVAAVMDREIARLKTELVSLEELDRVKTQSRAGLLRTLDSNQGMAALLAEYEAKTDDWRSLFEHLKAIDAITAEDVQRVAQVMFRPDNLTVGRLLPLEE